MVRTPLAPAAATHIDRFERSVAFRCSNGSGTVDHCIAVKLINRSLRKSGCNVNLPSETSSWALTMYDSIYLGNLDVTETTHMQACDAYTASKR